MPKPSNQAKATRLAELGASDAKLLRRLTRNAAERCQILCEGYTAHAAALSLDPATDPTVIEPKVTEE